MLMNCCYKADAFETQNTRIGNSRQNPACRREVLLSETITDSFVPLRFFQLPRIRLRKILHS